MTTRNLLRQKRTWLIGIPILLIAVFGGGPYVYIHFIEGDPPAKLALTKLKTTKTNATTLASKSLDGTWNATTGSAVQYRVGEVLFGQSTTRPVSTTRCAASISRPGPWRSTRRGAQSAKPCSRRSREEPASSTGITSRS